MSLQVNRLLENRPPLRLVTRSGMGVERGGAVSYREVDVKPVFLDVEPEAHAAGPAPEGAALSKAEKIARSIERAHGKSGLKRLLDGFLAQESGEVLARDLGVSRQRVHQWKQLLVEEITFVNLNPGVARVLNPPAEV
jgi:hypothetical protein